MDKDNKKLNGKSAKANFVKVKPKIKPAKTEKASVNEVVAKARFIKIASRKVRLVINQLPGLRGEEALNRLRFVNKAAVRPVIKLINSAIANAENNFSLDKKDLYIKKIIANDGPVLKRWKPRAHGRSSAIRKRTSHIELILGVEAGAKKKAAVKKEVKEEKVKIVNPDEVKKASLKIHGKESEEKGKNSKGFMKGIFQRKTG